MELLDYRSVTPRDRNWGAYLAILGAMLPIAAWFTTIFGMMFLQTLLVNDRHAVRHAYGYAAIPGALLLLSGWTLSLMTLRRYRHMRQEAILAVGFNLFATVLMLIAIPT